MFLEAWLSKPPLGGAATQTRDSLGNVLSRAQRTQFHRWDVMRCARLRANPEPTPSFATTHLLQ
jgi:hypothetical protein